MSTLAERLSLALASKKLSRRKLAQLSDVHVNTLNAWFKGETLNPQNDQLIQVAKVLEVPATWLRAGKGASDFDFVVTSREGRTMFVEAKSQPTPYSDQPDSLLLGQCFAAVLQALDRSTQGNPPPAKIGAVMAEIYGLCQREGRQPTPELVAPFVRVLLA